jgi:tetratricopeptide (TPR) repeat protein
MTVLVHFIALATLSSAPADVPKIPTAHDAVTYARLYQDVEGKIRAGQVGSVKIEDLKRLAQINSEDGTVQLYLGRALLANKDYDDAIAAYQKSIELGGFQNKHAAACHYDIACARALKGDTKAALVSLEQALQSGFRDLNHLRTDSDLSALHSHPKWEELSASKDVSKMSRDQGWRYDLWLLDREMRRMHFNPYTKHSPKEFDEFVKKLDRDIPKLTDAEIQLQFIRYSAMLNDGHTHMRMPDGSPLSARVPLQAFWFAEGVFITAAHPDHKDLLGAEILSVNGKSVSELTQQIDPYISRDNPQGVKNALPGRIMYPAMLHAAGLSPSATQISLRVRKSGQDQTVSIKSIANGLPDATWLNARTESKNPDPLYLKNRTKSYYFEHLPELKAVYFQYNGVRSDSADPLPAFCQRMFEFIDKNDVENLIVDVRWNGGGNSFLNRNIQDGIYARPKINQKGRLFVITGRNTFSAAQNFTTDLTRNANPILVGEPTGSSPNFIGESVPISLPYSKMTGSVSDLYWQRSWPMDGRIWLSPELPAPPTFVAYKDNVDVSMEAIRAYLASK